MSSITTNEGSTPASIAFSRSSRAQNAWIVEIGANFEPYRELRPVEVTRSEDCAITNLRYDYVIGCLVSRCLPRGTGRVEIGGVAVNYLRRGESEPSAATVEWVPIRAAGLECVRSWNSAARVRHHAACVAPFSFNTKSLRLARHSEMEHEDWLVQCAHFGKQGRRCAPFGWQDHGTEFKRREFARCAFCQLRYEARRCVFRNARKRAKAREQDLWAIS